MRPGSGGWACLVHRPVLPGPGTRGKTSLLSTPPIELVNINIHIHTQSQPKSGS